MGLSCSTLSNFCNCKNYDTRCENNFRFCPKDNKDNLNDSNQDLSYLTNNNNFKNISRNYSFEKASILSKIHKTNAVNKIINYYRKFKDKNTPIKNLKKSHKTDGRISKRKLRSILKKKNNSIYYLGNKNTKGLKDGFGMDIRDKKIKYIGFYKNDLASGIGKYIDGNEIYEGEFLNDFAFGFGIYKNSDNIIYEGEWVNDSQENYGIEKWKDGSKYFGEYKNGKKNGIGTYIWADGYKYEGEWVNNNLEGYGIYYGNNSFIYIGQWKKNLKNGFGELLWSDKKYIGFFSNDLKNGFGIYYCKNVNKAFSGFWKNGKRFGFGKYMDSKNKKYGLWDENGKVDLIKSEEEAFKVLENKNLKNYRIYFELSLDDISNYCVNNDEIDYLVKWIKITNNFY